MLESQDAYKHKYRIIMGECNEICHCNVKHYADDKYESNNAASNS